MKNVTKIKHAGMLRVFVVAALVLLFAAAGVGAVSAAEHVLYVHPSGTGSGDTPDTPSELQAALTKTRDFQSDKLVTVVIYLMDGEYNGPATSDSRVGCGYLLVQANNVNVVLQPVNIGKVSIHSQLCINGDGRLSGPESLIIKNLDFNLSSVDKFAEGHKNKAIWSKEFTDQTYCYIHNLLIDGCSFTGAGIENGLALDIARKGCRNISVSNSEIKKFTVGLGFYSTEGPLTVTNCYIHDVNEGINAQNSVSGDVLFSGNCINAAAYGIRIAINQEVLSDVLIEKNDITVLSPSIEDGPYDGAIVLRNADWSKSDFVIKDNVLTSYLSDNKREITFTNKMDFSGNYWGDAVDPLNRPTDVLLGFKIDVNNFIKSYYKGYKTVDVGKWSMRVVNPETLVDNAVAKIGNDRYDTLEAAVEAATGGATIELLKTVELTEQLTINKGITIDGQKHTIKANSDADWSIDDSHKHLVLVDSASSVTLKDIEFDCYNNGHQAASGVQFWHNPTVQHELINAVVNGTCGYAVKVGSANLKVQNFKSMNCTNNVGFDVEVSRSSKGQASTLDIDNLNGIEYNLNSADKQLFAPIKDEGLADGDGRVAAKVTVTDPLVKKIGVYKNEAKSSPIYVWAPESVIDEFNKNGHLGEGEEYKYAVSGADLAWSYYNSKNAISAATSGQTIKLLKDVVGVGDLVLPAGVTFDGNGKTISGDSAIFINADGGTVKNINFKNIHTASATLKSDRSAIYGKSFAGKAVIDGCTFDTCGWEAIQIESIVNEKVDIKITNNVFKTDESVIKTYPQYPNRYVHIQSANNVDFSVEVTGNCFYNGGLLRNTGLEVYYPTEVSKVKLSGNYIDEPVACCVGLKESYNDHPDLVFPLSTDAAFSGKYYPEATLTDDNVYIYKTLADAVGTSSKIASADELTLWSNVKLGQNIEIPADVKLSLGKYHKDEVMKKNSYEIDLQSYTLSGAGTYADTTPFISVPEGFTLTIKGTTGVFSANGGTAISLDGGKLFIDSGYFNGKISQTANYKLGDAKITGGKFTDDSVKKYVASGYYAKSIDEGSYKWEVVPGSEPKIEVKPEKKEGGKIEISTNPTGNTDVKVEEEGNKKSVTLIDTASNVEVKFVFAEGATEDDGKVTGTVSGVTATYPSMQAPKESDGAIPIKLSLELNPEELTNGIILPIIDSEYVSDAANKVKAAVSGASPLATVKGLDNGNTKITDINKKIKKVILTFTNVKGQFADKQEPVISHVADDTNKVTQVAKWWWSDNGNGPDLIFESELGFSTYVLSAKTVEEQPQSHSSRDYGASIWLPATAEPTAAPTPAAEPTQAVPTASPVKPTQAPATPAPFLGLLAGLGAAAVFFGLRRK